MFHRQLSRLVIGLFIIGVGLIALLGNAGFVDAAELRPYWPLVLVALGVVRLFSRWSLLPGLLLIGLGAALTAQNLGYIQLHWRDWWPVLLILVGLRFLLGRGERWGQRRWERRQARWARRHGLPFDAAADNSDRVQAEVVMGSSELRNASQDFQGGELSAVLGSVELDLRDAAMRGGEAVLVVKVVMGGVEIKVPRSWSVGVRVEHVMAGVDDRTAPPAVPAGRLLIDGEVVMGGVTIKN